MQRLSNQDFKKNVRFKSTTFYFALITLAIIFLTNIIYIVIFFSNSYLKYYFENISDFNNKTPKKFDLIGYLIIGSILLFFAFAFFSVAFYMDRIKIVNITVWSILSIAIILFIFSSIFFSISEQNYKKIEIIYNFKETTEKDYKFYRWKSIGYIWFMNVFKVCAIMYIYTIINNELCALNQTDVQTIIRLETNNRLNVLQNNRRFIRRFIAPSTSNILFWIVCSLFILLVPIILFIFLTLTNNSSLFELIRIFYYFPIFAKENSEILNDFTSLNFLINLIDVGMIALSFVFSIFFVFIINVYRDKKIEFVVIFAQVIFLLFSCIVLVCVWYSIMFLSKNYINNIWNVKMAPFFGKIKEGSKQYEEVQNIFKVLNIQSLSEEYKFSFRWLEHSQLYVFVFLSAQYFIVDSIVIFVSLIKNNKIIKQHKVTKFFEKKYFS